MLSRTGPTLIQVPFIATMTSLNNDDEGAGRRQDEFGRSPDNEIKTVKPTAGNTSATSNENYNKKQKYNKVHIM